MALIPCPECGRMVSPNAEECPNCGAPVKELTALKPPESKLETDCIEEETIPVDPAKESKETVEKQSGEISQQASNNNISDDDIQSSASVDEIIPTPKHSKKGIVVIIIVLLVLVVAAGGWFYYNNVYIPQKRDAEAPRYYVIAQNINMRSTPEFEADYNKIGSFPYGTEFIVYDSVKTGLKPYLYGKYAPRDAKGKVIKEKVVEGYLAYNYMASKADFFLLNSIFGNDDARKMLSESRYKKALLSYFKQNHYKGNISREDVLEYGGINLNATESWQVFCRHEKATSNNVYRSRKYRKDSKYTDLAVIITNLDGNERRLLYFVFDDDESFHLLMEQSAPYTGYMKDRTLKLKETDDGGYYVDVEYEQ